MTTKARLLSAVGGLALLVAAAACGSSGSKRSAGAATESPIEVGVICSCSGPDGTSTAAAGDVAHAWAKSVNAAGGLEGHPIDLKFFDDAGNAGTSVTDAQTLISDHVAVVEDVSIDDSTWASAFAHAKIPVVSGTANTTYFETNPDFYATEQTIGNLVYSQVALAKEAGATNLGILYCAEAAVCAQEAPLTRTYGKQLGVPLVYSFALSATAPNYTAQCVAAQQAKVTALITGVSSTTIARLGSDCQRQGYDPIYVAPSAAYETSTSRAPGIENLWVEFGELPYFENAPEVQTLNAVIDKYYPGVRQGKGGILWESASVTTWTAGLLIRDAVKGSGVGPTGTVTAATLTQGLNTLKNDTLDGWAPPLTFTAGKPHPVNCWFTVHFTNGTPHLLNNGKPTCVSGSAS